MFSSFQFSIWFLFFPVFYIYTLFQFPRWFHCFSFLDVSIVRVFLMTLLFQFCRSFHCSSFLDDSIVSVFLMIPFWQFSRLFHCHSFLDDSIVTVFLVIPLSQFSRWVDCFSFLDFSIVHFINDSIYLQEIADPFYAHCRMHGDKLVSKQKKRNFLALHGHVKQFRETKSNRPISVTICRRTTGYFGFIALKILLAKCFIYSAFEAVEVFFLSLVCSFWQINE